MENPIKMDDLGVPVFSETPKSLWTPTARFKGDHQPPVLHVVSRKDLSDQEAVGKVAFHISHTGEDSQEKLQENGAYLGSYIYIYIYSWV